MDTHLLLWWASMPEQLPEPARSRLASSDRPLFFSLVSLWEVAIKASLGQEDFQVDPAALRMGLLREGFQELPIEVEHMRAAEVALDAPRSVRPPVWWLRPCGKRILLGYGDRVLWAG